MMRARMSRILDGRVPAASDAGSLRLLCGQRLSVLGSAGRFSKNVKVSCGVVFLSFLPLDMLETDKADVASKNNMTSYTERERKRVQSWRDSPFWDERQAPEYFTPRESGKQYGENRYNWDEGGKTGDGRSVGWLEKQHARLGEAVE